jgi:virulence factor Mce-like protein
MNERLILEIRRSLRSFILYIILAAVAFATFLAITGHLTFRRPWEGYNTYKVAFDEVKGIVPNKHEVRISGVVAGVVSKSEIVDGHPVLTLKIRDKYGPLYNNAHFQIRPVTPLQDLYVNVTDRGTPRAGKASADHTIPSDHVISPVDISSILNSFDGDTRQHLTVLLDELGAGLSGNGEQLKAAFVELSPFLKVAQDATRELAERKTNVRRLIHNFGGLTTSLATRDKQLAQLVTQGNATLGALARNDQALNATIGELPPAMTAIRSTFRTVDSLTGELNPAVTSLRPVAATLKSGLTGLEQLGDEATPSLRALRPAVRSLRPLAKSLVPTSEALSKALASLRPQAPQFNELTRQVTGCRKKMGLFFANTLEVFKFGDANGGFPRAELTADTDSVNLGGKTLAAPLTNGSRLPSCADNNFGGTP